MRTRRNRMDSLYRVLGGSLPEPGTIDPEQLAQRLGTTRSEVLRLVRDAREQEGLRRLRAAE